MSTREHVRDISDICPDDLANIAYAFVDLDGTGLSNKKFPSNGFWASVQAFEASGGRAITATGNAREAAILKLQQGDASGHECPQDSGGDGLFSSGADLKRLPGIYQNGAEVRGKDGSEISQTWLDFHILEMLLDWFNGLGPEQRQKVGIAFQSYGDVYILEGPSSEIDVPASWTAARGSPLHVLALEKWSRAPYYWGEGWAQALSYQLLKRQLSKSNVHCAMILTSARDQEYWTNHALKALGSFANHVCHCIGLTDAPPLDRSAYVFTHPEANKGSALELLMQHFGGSANTSIAGKVVAFGDNLNDKPMFTSEGVLGIAIGNAREELKEVAYALTGTNEDEGYAGVAQALMKITEARTRSSDRSSAVMVKRQRTE